MAGGSDLRLRQ